MGEAPNIYPNLNDQQQFRLNKINESSAGIASASFSLAFSISTGIIKNC